MSAYTPIACAFHDRLEHHAVRGEAVRVVWRDGDTERAETVRILDVAARDGADWVVLGTAGGPAHTVRADALVSVDGHALPLSC